MLPALLTAAVCLASFPLSPPAAEEAMSEQEVRAFMRELAEYIEAHHLKKDPKSPQKGMVYEYVDTTKIGQEGQWIQGEALDTMHDGAWYAAAMVDAFRATGEEHYREFLTEYPVPFYTNILNHSDALFRDGMDEKKIAPSKHTFKKSHRYMGEKGFCPYFWDDGASLSLERELAKTGTHPFMCVDYDLLAGRANPEGRLNGFSLGCSNHMAQDLAVMLLKTWQLTGDERIARAAMHLHESRLLHHGPIPMVVAAAAGTNRDEELRKRLGRAAGFEPRNAYTVALAEASADREQAMPGFADNQEYDYHVALVRDGTLTRPAAAQLIYDAYTLPMLVRYWSDTEPVPPGMNRSEGAHIHFRGGKPTSYRSDRDLSMGPRMGPQMMVVTAWALQALRAHGGVWEDRYRKEFSGDLLVRFHDSAIEVDGRAEEGYCEPLKAGAAQLRLAAERSHLCLWGEAPGESVKIELLAQPDAERPAAAIEIGPSGVARVENAEGKRLIHQAKVSPSDGGFAFELRIPFTVVKGQETWLNGVEHGRYAVRLGDANRSFYLLSSEEQVRKALQRELVGGLASWRAVFRELGYLPIAHGKTNIWTFRGTRVNKISESGGYAHLIKAAAQYLLYQQGKRDWAAKEAGVRRQESGGGDRVRPERGAIRTHPLATR